MWKKIKEFFSGKKKQVQKAVKNDTVIRVINLYPATPLQKRPTMRPNTRAQHIEPVDVAQWLRNVREVDKLRKKMVQFA